jgi:hypothetical protein
VEARRVSLKEGDMVATAVLLRVMPTARGPPTCGRQQNIIPLCPQTGRNTEGDS